MTTCHQCGSQVAETDAFCPFCGISLAPIAVPAGEEDEFASTIIMPTAKSEPSPVETEPAPAEGPETPLEPVPVEAPVVEVAQAEPGEEVPETIL
jgi:hypothetical protein